MADDLCQHCTENPATIHVTEVEGGSKVHSHYCEACATLLGVSNEEGMFGLVAKPSMLAAGARKLLHQNKCPNCGISFEEFRAKGRLGCPKDYEAFEAALGPLLQQMHGGGTTHRGRLPRGRAEADMTTSDRLIQLRRELRDAIGKERYEEAARLRDEIQHIESARDEPGLPELFGDA